MFAAAMTYAMVAVAERDLPNQLGISLGYLGLTWVQKHTANDCARGPSLRTCATVKQHGMAAEPAAVYEGDDVREVCAERRAAQIRDRDMQMLLRFFSRKLYPLKSYLGS
jgi:hypothetical protein